MVIPETLYDRPMKYTTGLKTVEPAVILESTKELMRSSVEVSERALELLTAALTVILEKPTHDEFDRATVQLTARIIACCRAAYDSLRSGHLVAANAMARDVVENTVLYYHLARNEGSAGAWLDARSLPERRKYEFTRTVKSFPPEQEKAWRGLFDLFSGEAHANHWAFLYVKFRLPFGVNFYLSGCFNPVILASLLEACCTTSLSHLEHIRRWHGDTPGFQDVCSLEAFSSLGQEMERVMVLLETEAANVIQTTERADNLSQEEIRDMEAIKDYIDSRSSLSGP